VLTASLLASGSHFVIFDADREYRASDLVVMFQPIVDGTAEVVFGVRMFGMNTVYHSFRYAIGNRVTTLVANVLFDSCLTDLHSCLKMVPSRLFRSLTLTRANFGLDSEITAELLRRGYRPYEVPVSYVGRSHSQGKKLTWRDGIDCLRVLGSVRLRPKPVAQDAPLATGDGEPVVPFGRQDLDEHEVAQRWPLRLVTGHEGQQREIALPAGMAGPPNDAMGLDPPIELREGDGGAALLAARPDGGHPATHERCSPPQRVPR